MAEKPRDYDRVYMKKDGALSAAGSATPTTAER